MKLTRKDIQAGLEATPIDTLLLGEPKTLTHKQKEFAKGVALGKPKAQAYREAYNTNTNKQAQAVEAHRLAQNPNISLMIEAMKVGIEAQKYLLPAHLRALTIQKLTEKAIDPDVKPAQQLKALELLGKITEVALFTERKEITTSDTSAKAKDKLIDTLAKAIRSSSNISLDKKKEADALLAEITGGSLDNPNPDTIDQLSEDNIDQDHKSDAHLSNEADPEPIQDIATPPTATPSNLENLQVAPTHTIPDNQIPSESIETPPLSFTESEWGGGDNFWQQFEEVPTEKTPLTESGSHTPPVDISNPNWREV